MNLYVIRHAIAVEAGSSGYENDSQRTLTDKGRRKMENIALGLRRLDVSLDLILSSPYLRARQTAEILAEAFEMKQGPVLSQHLAPGGDLDEFFGEINEKYPVDSLAVVGHEPSLSTMISILLAGNPNVMVNMRKGGVCCLALDNLHHERRAMLEWLLAPNQLAKLGER
ncbi:MAG TPA: phosphohistidine phosphatase SixA [Anaerolineales bacterium]|jgi:phosphohistidine phosphatase